MKKAEAFKKGNLLWAVWCWTWGIIITLISGTTVILVTLFPNSENAAHIVARYWGWLLCKVSLVKLSLHGLKNIDPDKPYVFASNHQGHFDILAGNAILPFQFRWVSKKEYFMVPIFGWAMKRAGYISTDRYNLRKAALGIREGVERLKEGTSVVLFPEGARTRDGHIIPFLDGAFALAIKAQVPVVPMVIVGSMEIINMNTLRPRTGHVRIYLGTPIPTNGMKLKDRVGLSRTVRKAMRDIFYRESGFEPPRTPKPAP